MHKTILVQNNKAKHTSNTNKNKKGREKKWQNHLEHFFFHTLEEPFSFSEPLSRWWGGRVKIVQVWKEHEGFEKISKESKRGWKLTLVSQRDHAVALLSG